MISNIGNQVIIQGNLVKAPVKIGDIVMVQ